MRQTFTVLFVISLACAGLSCGAKGGSSSPTAPTSPQEQVVFSGGRVQLTNDNGNYIGVWADIPNITKVINSPCPGTCAKYTIVIGADQQDPAPGNIVTFQFGFSPDGKGLDVGTARGYALPAGSSQQISNNNVAFPTYPSGSTYFLINATYKGMMSNGKVIIPQSNGSASVKVQ